MAPTDVWGAPTRSGQATADGGLRERPAAKQITAMLRATKQRRRRALGRRVVPPADHGQGEVRTRSITASSAGPSPSGTTRHARGAGVTRRLTPGGALPPWSLWTTRRQRRRCVPSPAIEAARSTTAARRSASPRAAAATARAVVRRSSSRFAKRPTCTARLSCQPTRPGKPTQAGPADRFPRLRPGHPNPSAAPTPAHTPR